MNNQIEAEIPNEGLPELDQIIDLLKEEEIKEQIKEFDFIEGIEDAEKYLYLESQAQLLERNGYEVKRPEQVEYEWKQKQARYKLGDYV